MRKLAFLFLAALANFSFAQDVKQEEKAMDAQAVAELYKDSIVDVETQITYEDGSKGGMGGSGFFVDAEGHLVTNDHVIHQDEVVKTPFGNIKLPAIERYEYWVVLKKTPANRKYKAKLVGWNKYVDIALLKAEDVDPKDFKVAKLGDSSKVKQGEKVFAYGSPFGLKNSIGEGVVSEVHVYINLQFIEDYIQTTAPINPGNSGSPLINTRGEVIGINNAVVGGANNIGFSIPINLCDPAKLKKGEAKIGYLGCDMMLDNFDRTGTPGSPGFQEVQELNKLTGIEDLKSLEVLANQTWDRWAVILKLYNHNSPAMKSGMKMGDLVTHFNGKVVKSGREIRLLMLDIEPEKEFEIKVLRVEKGALKELTFKIAMDKKRKED